VTGLLEVRGLSAGYNGSLVVRGLDLSVAEGEIVALLGANGAGKTTTLLAVSGFLPSTGEVTLRGKTLSHQRPHRIARLGLAHVPEDRSLFPGLTVAEHLRLMKGRSAVTTDDIFGYFPELSALEGRAAGLLSGGEQQMLALGRALMAGPQVLMVDEMSLGLAPVIVERLLPVLRRVASTTGTGILLVEQHVQLVLAHADRAYVLSHGELALDGDADRIAASADLVEATYLGQVVP
jgi:branched-chain amino acid transport system ATP-binding protein